MTARQARGGQQSSGVGGSTKLLGKIGENSGVELDQVRSKKEVIDEARTSGATVHVASLMDICHLKNAELEAKHQKYQGRVALRGDIVKDNSGSYAVLSSMEDPIVPHERTCWQDCFGKGNFG